jgi:hypothetical protein
MRERPGSCEARFDALAIPLGEIAPFGRFLFESVEGIDSISKLSCVQRAIRVGVTTRDDDLVDTGELAFERLYVVVSLADLGEMINLTLSGNCDKSSFVLPTHWIGFRNARMTLWT